MKEKYTHFFFLWFCFVGWKPFLEQKYPHIWTKENWRGQNQNKIQQTTTQSKLNLSKHKRCETKIKKHKKKIPNPNSKALARKKEQKNKFQQRKPQHQKMNGFGWEKKERHILTQKFGPCRCRWKGKTKKKKTEKTVLTITHQQKRKGHHHRAQESPKKQNNNTETWFLRLCFHQTGTRRRKRSFVGSVIYFSTTCVNFWHVHKGHPVIDSAVIAVVVFFWLSENTRLIVVIWSKTVGKFRRNVVWVPVSKTIPGTCKAVVIVVVEMLCVPLCVSSHTWSTRAGNVITGDQLTKRIIFDLTIISKKDLGWWRTRNSCLERGWVRQSLLSQNWHVSTVRDWNINKIELLSLHKQAQTKRKKDTMFQWVEFLWGHANTLSNRDVCQKRNIFKPLTRKNDTNQEHRRCIGWVQLNSLPQQVWSSLLKWQSFHVWHPKNTKCDKSIPQWTWCKDCLCDLVAQFSELWEEGQMTTEKNKSKILRSWREHNFFASKKERKRKERERFVLREKGVLCGLCDTFGFFFVFQFISLFEFVQKFLVVLFALKCWKLQFQLLLPPLDFCKKCKQHSNFLIFFFFHQQNFLCSPLFFCLLLLWLMTTRFPAYRFSVAPMMDWTDRHCRFFHRLFTKHALLYTEMVTKKRKEKQQKTVSDRFCHFCKNKTIGKQIPIGAVIHGKVNQHLQFNAEEHPVAVQFGGNVPEQLAVCADIATNIFGYDEINLNVGCPSDRVLQGSFGASLMPNHDLLRSCVTKMADAVKNKVPVTVKLRTGIEDRKSGLNYDSDVFLFDLVNKLTDAGCDRIIIHARKAILGGKLSPKQNRSIPPLNYSRAHDLSHHCAVPIIINGGFDGPNDAKPHLAKGCQGVMIGRKSYKKPFGHTLSSWWGDVWWLKHQQNHKTWSRDWNGEIHWQTCRNWGQFSSKICHKTHVGIVWWWVGSSNIPKITFCWREAGQERRRDQKSAGSIRQHTKTKKPTLAWAMTTNSTLQSASVKSILTFCVVKETVCGYKQQRMRCEANKHEIQKYWKPTEITPLSQQTDHHNHNNLSTNRPSQSQQSLNKQIITISTKPVLWYEKMSIFPQTEPFLQHKRNLNPIDAILRQIENVRPSFLFPTRCCLFRPIPQFFLLFLFVLAFVCEADSKPEQRHPVVKLDLLAKQCPNKVTSEDKNWFSSQQHKTNISEEKEDDLSDLRLVSAVQKDIDEQVGHSTWKVILFPAKSEHMLSESILLSLFKQQQSSNKQVNKQEKDKRSQTKNEYFVIARKKHVLHSHHLVFQAAKCCLVGSSLLWAHLAPFLFEARQHFGWLIDCLQRSESVVTTDYSAGRPLLVWCQTTAGACLLSSQKQHCNFVIVCNFFGDKKSDVWDSASARPKQPEVVVVQLQVKILHFDQFQFREMILLCCFDQFQSREMILLCCFGVFWQFFWGCEFEHIHCLLLLFFVCRPSMFVNQKKCCDKLCSKITTPTTHNSSLFFILLLWLFWCTLVRIFLPQKRKNLTRNQKNLGSFSKRKQNFVSFHLFFLFCNSFAFSLFTHLPATTTPRAFLYDQIPKKKKKPEFVQT